jgi:hypothetical protein
MTYSGSSQHATIAANISIELKPFYNAGHVIQCQFFKFIAIAYVYAMLYLAPFLCSPFGIRTPNSEYKSFFLIGWPEFKCVF